MAESSNRATPLLHYWLTPMFSSCVAASSHPICQFHVARACRCCTSFDAIYRLPQPWMEGQTLSTSVLHVGASYDTRVSVRAARKGRYSVVSDEIWIEHSPDDAQLNTAT